MTFLSSFRDHPASVGEGYFGHMWSAFGFGGRMVYGGLCCLIHGIFPFLCVQTGSRQVRHLHDAMVVHRQGPPAEVTPSRLRTAGQRGE